MKTKENVKNKNFTKLTRGGISLIVLVITIIVIIILAAAVILTINNNNPIMEANKARYESDRANMQAVFTNAVAKVMTHNRATVNVTAGQVNTTISGVKEATGEVAYTVTNAMNSANSSGKVVFDKGDSTDTVFYTGKKLPIYAAGETKWYVDEEGNIILEVAGVKYGSGAVTSGSGSGGSGSGNTGTTVTAQTVANNASTYYGEKVTNYKTGNSTIDNQVEWQIFYADTNNIYLIATDYIHYDIIPKVKVTSDSGTETVYELNKSGDYRADFDNILDVGLYTGSEDIIDTRLQALNESFYSYLKTNNLTNTGKSMQAVAYMMDIREDVWGSFAGEYADYAIGGPTVEMFMKSYSKKYDVDYRAQVSSVEGYQISIDAGESWSYAYNEILDDTDRQYVISSYLSAFGMWLASPYANPTSDAVYETYYGDVIGTYCYNETVTGFRPVVCLNSNVTLKAVTDGYEIE